MGIGPDSFQNSSREASADGLGLKLVLGSVRVIFIILRNIWLGLGLLCTTGFGMSCSTKLYVRLITASDCNLGGGGLAAFVVIRHSLSSKQ